MRRSARIARACVTDHHAPDAHHEGRLTRSSARWPWFASEPDWALHMDTSRYPRFCCPGHRMTGDRTRMSSQQRNGLGYDFCHAIIDDHSRMAYVELHDDERAETVTGYVERALVGSARHGEAGRALRARRWRGPPSRRRIPETRVNSFGGRSRCPPKRGKPVLLVLRERSCGRPPRGRLSRRRGQAPTGERCPADAKRPALWCCADKRPSLGDGLVDHRRGGWASVAVAHLGGSRSSKSLRRFPAPR